jgi:hypothetical protein
LQVRREQAERLPVVAMKALAHKLARAAYYMLRGKRLATTVQFFVDVTGASGTSYLLWDVSLSGNDQQDIVTG